ncbi:YraN family protein [Zhongshania guokunii]|uniref:UPF0102 protein AB4876_06035 n=1 Tax=Zhongshania guokunii TaxID=641783 RepID=A0ABV3U3S7_9GAMM
MFLRATAADSGKRAELAAGCYLEKHKLKIIERNYRCRLGEIDIIALSTTHLVFVEVRYRHSNSFGSGAESVTLRKQQRIMLTARHYLGSRACSAKYRELPCRFDVIEASPEKNGELHFNWLPNAFQE